VLPAVGAFSVRLFERKVLAPAIEIQWTGGPLFAGNRHRVATRKIPTFVLRMHVSSSEKAPKGKFEHRWFAEQPSQQARRRAGHSNPVPVLPQRPISI